MLLKLCVKGTCRAVGYLQTDYESEGWHVEGPAPAGLKFRDAHGAVDYLASGVPPGAR